jgi:hypothetical protein
MGKKQFKNDPVEQYDDFFEAFKSLNSQNPINNKPKNRDLGAAMAPKFQGYNTGINQSKYDSNFNWNAQADYEDIQGSIKEHRAQTQPWLDKASAGLARVSTKILAETAKLPGYVGGAIMSLGAEEGEGFETAFNNQWIKSINELNEKVNTEYLPVYVKKSVEEGNLWDNISSVDFWATEGADGIGFIASMLVPGAIFKSLGLGSKAMGATTKGLAMIKNNSKLAGAVRTIEGLGLNAKNFDVAGTAIVNTYIESAAEAGNAMENFNKNKDSIINSYLQQGLSVEEAEKQFVEQKGRLGRDIFVSNVGILAIPNLIQSKMIWGKAVNKLAKVDNPSVLKKIGNRSKDVLGATASEGFLEEAGQMTVENMFTDKAKRGELKEGFFGTAKSFNISELGQAYLDTVSSTEGQKAMFLGAFLGGGMSAYSGAKQDISDRKNSASIQDWINSEEFNFNTLLEEDTYLRDEEGNIQYHPNNEPVQDPKKVIKRFEALQATEKLNAQYEKAVQNGDYKTAEEIQKIAETQFLLPFARKGEPGIQALRENLEATIKSEDVQSTNENKQAESKVKDLISRAEKMQKKYETYQDFSRDLIVLNNENATDEQKIGFYNYLADNYVYKEGLLYESKKQLNKLNQQKSELLSELEDNVMIKTNEIVDENTQDDAFKYKFEEDPRIVRINKDIENTSKKIKSINNRINNQLWDSEKVNKIFDKFVNQTTKVEKATSPEVELEYDTIISDLESISSKEDLINYVNKLDSKYTENDIIQSKIEDIFKELGYKELLQKQLEQQQAEEKDAEKFQEDKDFGTTTTPETTDKVGEKTNIQGLETVQTSKNAEVDSDNNEYDRSPKELVVLEESTNPSNVDKNQGSAKVLSTNRDTGETLFSILEPFVQYEKESRDKTKDEVTFELGDIVSNNVSEILLKLKNENLTESEIKELEEKLPIKVNFKNGNKKVFSFIEALTDNISKNPDSLNVFNNETLPLRKSIIQALIDNKGSFEGIKGNIKKQFSGVLKLGEQNSNILELDVFKGMTQEQKLDYFKKNTVYVSNKGETKFTYNDKLDENSSLKDMHRGEVFLKIPMLNGKMFYLKLNTSRLSENKARQTFELIKLYSNLMKNKQSSEAQNFDYNSLREFIETNNLNEVLPELELIEKSNEPIEINLERLINTIVFFQNTNTKTKLIVDENGTLALGELLQKVNKEVNDSIGHYTYTTDTLNGLTELQQEAIVKYLMYKRHNVLITKDETSTFNNDDYLKYLLSEQSPVLTTNAVVNEPTFQGYSNIYLNQTVTNSNKTQPKEVPSEKVEDLSAEELLASLSYSGDVSQPIKTTTSNQLNNKNEVSINEIVKLFKQVNIQNRKIGNDIGDKDSIMQILWNLISKDENDSKATVISYAGFGKINIDGIYTENNVMIALSEVIKDEFILDEISENFNKILKYEGLEYKYDLNKSQEIVETITETLKESNVVEIFKNANEDTQLKMFQNALKLNDKKIEDFEGTIEEFKELVSNIKDIKEINKICAK